MEPEEYDKMRRLEDTYWWFVGRRNLVRTFLDRYAPQASSFLDIGCGTGGMSKELERRGSVVSLDFEHAALNYARTRGLHRLVQSSAEALPFPAESFDAVTALDVVEHLDDDHAAASEISRVLKVGGTAVITVPAFAFLWSEHDVALHHRRRYREPEIARLFRDAGLRIRRVSYVMAFLFPAVAAVRGIQRALGSGRKTLDEAKTTLPDVPGPLNGLLTGLLRAEAGLLHFMDFPWGVSLVCVAQKEPRPADDAQGVEPKS